METVGRFMLSISVCGMFFLGGIHFGRIDGENRLLNTQVRSADVLADKIGNKDCSKEILADLDDFTFDVCKGLGLIK